MEAQEQQLEEWGSLEDSAPELEGLGLELEDQLRLALQVAPLGMEDRVQVLAELALLVGQALVMEDRVPPSPVLLQSETQVKQLPLEV